MIKGLTEGIHEECEHFLFKNVLLSPSNCRFSSTMQPWLLGSAVWEKGKKKDEGGGMRGCLLLKEACRSLSRHIQPSTPSSKWDPQQGLLCLCSLFIYSWAPWKTFSLILSHSPTPPPVSSALSVWGRMPLENCCSQRSPPSRSGSVNIFNSTCLCECAHV